MEGYEASTYGDRFAEVYDDWYPATAETAAAVDRVAALAGSAPGVVLELGIGTGRLALPLVARGLDVRGVDASAAMVDRLRAKPGGDQAAVVVGDIATPVMPGRPGEQEPPLATVIIAADNTFFGILDPADQARCLHQLAGLLAPDGVLVVGALVPDGEQDSDGAGDSSGAQVTLRSMTVDTVVLSVARRDPDRRIMEGQYVELAERGLRLHPWMIRYCSPHELDSLAADAGLVLTDRFENWHGDPYDPEGSPEHVSLYRRRGHATRPAEES